jgi:mannitol-1-/sugar-/sorbitol-6-phosphatase
MSATLLRCEAVLFDCDGVLVDSDASVVRCWTRWAAVYGFDADTVVAMAHGRRSSDTVAELVPSDRRAEASALIDQLEFEDAATVTAIAGALGLTRAVPRWAVVTSGNRRLAAARLAAAGFDRPPAIVTADDVARGKPDPEGYLAAARQLSVDPAGAIVLEDAAAGIAAARAAGVSAVVAVGDRGELAGDVHVADLTALEWDGQGLRAS